LGREPAFVICAFLRYSQNVGVIDAPYLVTPAHVPNPPQRTSVVEVPDEAAVVVEDEECRV
jgi:hypothetical protein